MRKRMRSRHLIKATGIDSMQQIDLCSASNPEENATQNLLMISSEDFEINAPQYLHVPAREHSKLKERNVQTPSLKSREVRKERISVVEHYTECYKMSHKPHPHELNEEHLNHLQRNVVNPCSFLLFSNQHYDNLKVFEGEKLGSTDKINLKLRQNKTFSSFMRKRNKSLMKQYLDLSKQLTPQPSLARRGPPPPALCRMTKSCEIKKKDIEQPLSPMKIVSPVKVDNQNWIELQCTNPAFRNKRANYRQFRYVNSREPISARVSVQK